MFKTALLPSPARKGALAACAVAALVLAALSPASSAQRGGGEPELVDRNTPSNLDFTVTNDGTAGLFFSPTFSGGNAGDFSASSGVTSLAPGESTTLGCASK